LSREPTLDELIGDDTTGGERQRLQRVHEQLLDAGPPPELTPKLEAGPTLGTTMGKRRRSRPRALLLIAAALAIFLVFFGGYGFGNHGGGGTTKSTAASLALKGTRLAPHAAGALRVWSSRDGSNWPMTLSVSGLPKLPPRNYYEVYLFRHGKILGSCGAFSVGGTGASDVTVTLTSPYPLEQGDSWVVTRPGPGGTEPGQMVLRPVQA
jgi:hypothetical protein